MSLLSRLFGSSTTPEPQVEAYKDMQIFPDPQKEGNNYRLTARIVGGDGQQHLLIRADTFQSLDEATQASLNKAKQMIDEQGARLFT